MPEPAAYAPSAAPARAVVDRTTLLKLISGGQTGVDRGALDAALNLRVPCGGWCPAGRLAEDGKIPDRYPVIELAGGGYAERTAKNAADSDGTLIITEGPPTGGTYETVERCVQMQKPHLIIDCETMPMEEAIEQVLKFVRSLSSRADARDLADEIEPAGNSPTWRQGTSIVLNVAGPRASQWPGGNATAQKIMSVVLQRLSGHGRADEYSA